MKLFLIALVMSVFATGCATGNKLMKNCSQVGEMGSGDMLSECSDL